MKVTRRPLPAGIQSGTIKYVGKKSKTCKGIYSKRVSKSNKHCTKFNNKMGEWTQPARSYMCWNTCSGT